MWSWLSAAAAATAAALLCACPAHSDSGLAGSTFSNELRTGYTRLFQNGVEQTSSSPLQPFVLVQRNPAADFLGRAPLLLQPQRQAAAAFSPSAPTFHVPRPRFNPSWGGGKKKPNDVLVVVVKTSGDCARKNGTKPVSDDDGSADDDDDDDSDEDGPNPDDDVEEVTIVTGGAQKGKEPSRCVWAILSCCAPANTPVRYSCFDVLGCSTAFWDTNPCVPAILRAALEQATLYYGPVTSSKNGTDTPATTPPPAAPPSSTTAAAAAASSIVDLTGTATAAAPTA